MSAPLLPVRHARTAARCRLISARVVDIEHQPPLKDRQQDADQFGRITILREGSEMLDMIYSHPALAAVVGALFIVTVMYVESLFSE